MTNAARKDIPINAINFDVNHILSSSSFVLTAPIPKSNATKNSHAYLTRELLSKFQSAPISMLVKQSL